MEVFGVVYLLINLVNGKMYVGQTIQPLKARMKQHLGGKLCVDKAIRKHKPKNFRCEILKCCASKAELDAWERFFIAALKTKSPLGYNMTDGGDGVIGMEFTPEHRAKISAALKGRPKSPEHREKLAVASSALRGEKNPFFGKRHTAETKLKIALAKRGKPLSPETRKKMSVARRGVPKSPETRKKLSVALSGERNPRFGKKNTPEHQAKIVAGNLGKKRTPETCAKISTALTGKTFTAERCANISAANRHYSPYKNLLAELDARQMSYAALAKLLGITAGKVSMKMRCERNFTERDKVKLVEIFGKPIEYLLARD